LDSADSCSIDGGDLHVTVLTPVSVPGVSEDVVVLSTFGAISDKSNSMVKGSSAGDIVEDTSLVVLEHSLVSFNGYSDWLLYDRSLQLRDRVLWYVGEVLDLDSARKILSEARAWQWSNV